MDTMRRTLIVIFFTIFLDLLGVGIVVPVLPQLLGNPDSPVFLLDRKNGIQLGLILHGILFSVYALAQFIASPLLGQLSDKIGRRKVLAGAMLLTAISQAGFAFAISTLSIVLLFITRILAGIASGNIPVAQAVVADSTPEDKRSTALGVIGAAFGLGLILGPVIGGKLMQISPSAPFLIASLLALINCFFLYITLKETHKTKSKLNISRFRLKEAFLDIKKAFYHKTLRPVFIVYFFMQFGFAVYISFASIHLLRRFHMGDGEFGAYFAFAGLCAVLAQVVVVRLVAKKHKEKAVIAPGLALNALGLIGIAISPTIFWLYISTLIFATGYGLVYANISSLLSMSKEERGTNLGYLGSVMALGLAIPPLFGGVISVSLSPQTFLLIASLFVSGASLYFYNSQRRHLKTF
jgi:DHA1 family tetracycline resistance protein-like MFS transporter